MKQLPIKAWAADDRPREKMLAKGAAALSNAELLAILLGSGTPEETAVQLAQRILQETGNKLNALGKLSIPDLTGRFKGVGPAKAVRLLAAIELGKRRAAEMPAQRAAITSSRDIYDLLSVEMADLPHEEFWVIYLNRANRIIDRAKVGQGGLNEVTADIRLILKSAVQLLASGMIAVHNHPSGNLRPSRQDDELTRRLKGAGDLLGVALLDHIIVGDGGYYSYADEGRV